MKRCIKTAVGWLAYINPLRSRQRKISTFAGLVSFLHRQAAFIAQTSLFGYLKTRMGTQYRAIFQDERFSAPLARARTEVFFFCLADLTVFAVAHAAGRALPEEACRAAARRCFGAALDAALPGDVRASAAAAEAEAAFERRLATVDWAAASEGETAFVESPAGLVDAAPVIEGYKVRDREIVMNSIRFRWIDIRRRFRAKADAPALCREIAELV